MVAATLDVNVLVSAAISPRGTPHRLIEAWHAGRFDVITSAHIIDQLTIKLRSDRIGRRYRLTSATIRAFIGPLHHDARLITLPPDQVILVTGDPEDDAVLATARLGRADYLVTGDGGLLTHSPYEGIHIVTPRAFLELLDR